LEQPIVFGPTYCLEEEPHVHLENNLNQHLNNNQNNLSNNNHNINNDNNNNNNIHDNNSNNSNNSPSNSNGQELNAQQNQGASNHNDGAIKLLPCEQTEEQKNQLKQRVKVYASKRIPAWCDRITYTKEALKHIRDCTYDAIYAHSTGDHMPVFLSFTITK